MKPLIATALLTISILFSMDIQAQSFKTIEANPFKLQVYNASENSFGVASIIISAKTEAVLIDAQFTLEDAEKVAQEIKNTGEMKW